MSLDLNKPGRENKDVTPGGKQIYSNRLFVYQAQQTGKPRGARTRE
jgi:hypothetical protein